MKRQFNNRFCEACKEEYNPTGSTQKYCKKCTPLKRIPRNKKPIMVIDHDVNDISWG